MTYLYLMFISSVNIKHKFTPTESYDEEITFFKEQDSFVTYNKKLSYNKSTGVYGYKVDKMMFIFINEDEI